MENNVFYGLNQAENKPTYVCYGCKNSRYYGEYGWKCSGYFSSIMINGVRKKWLEQDCFSAYNNECFGEGYIKTILPAFFRKNHIAFFAPIFILLAFVGFLACG